MTIPDDDLHPPSSDQQDSFLKSLGLFTRQHRAGHWSGPFSEFMETLLPTAPQRIARTSHQYVREAILAPRFNYGAPCITVNRMGADGSLDLRHDYLRDKRGLDLPQAERVMEYVARVWRRPLTLHTVDFRGLVRILPARKTGI